MVRRSAARLTMQLRFHVYCTSIVATLILPLDHLDCRRLKISWIQKNFSTFQSGNISRAPCCTYLHIYEMVYTYMRWFTHTWDGLHIYEMVYTYVYEMVQFKVFSENMIDMLYLRRMLALNLFHACNIFTETRINSFYNILQIKFDMQ